MIYFLCNLVRDNIMGIIGSCKEFTNITQTTGYSTMKLDEPITIPIEGTHMVLITYQWNWDYGYYYFPSTDSSIHIDGRTAWVYETGLHSFNINYVAPTLSISNGI